MIREIILGDTETSLESSASDWCQWVYIIIIEQLSEIT